LGQLSQLRQAIIQVYKLSQHSKIQEKENATQRFH
jgi:hypothetical protein